MVQNSSSLNPLLTFPDNSQLAEMSINGIVVDRVYGATGVLNAIQDNSAAQYQDPNSNQINPPYQISLQNQGNNTIWYSDLVDDIYNTGYALAFQFNKTTYINYVTFDILNVPCTWELLQVSGSYSPIIGGTQLAQGVINGTNSQGWINFEESLVQTYEFNTATTLVLVINKLTTGTQYQLGVQNFLTKLIVKSINDIEINNSIINNFITQNNLGFVETYTPVVYDYSNFTTPNQNSAYWKCSPQPVKDAVVWFTVDFGQTEVVNRMYVDPLYTGCSFNLYWSTDNINWTPINQDLTLHKGIYKLNPICARYLKLEFSQLAPEVYDLPLDSINRVVQVFPDYVDTYFLGLENALLNEPTQSYNNLVGNTPNVIYNNSPSITSNYGALAGQLTSNQYGGPPSNLGLPNLGANNSNYSVVDPTVSYKNLQDIANEGSIFSNVGDTPFMNRRFYQYGPHLYKYVLINQTWHQAYFVGLKYLSFYNKEEIGFPQ